MSEMENELRAAKSESEQVDILMAKVAQLEAQLPAEEVKVETGEDRARLWKAAETERGDDGVDMVDILIAKVAELETQLSARDAEIAQLKGEVEPEVKVKSEEEVKVESEDEVAALRAKVAKLEAERKDTMKQSLIMLCERDNTIKAHERMLELLGTRVEKTETKINYISMEAEGDEDKSDEDTDTGGAA